jgi:hypothetical protein
MGPFWVSGFAGLGASTTRTSGASTTRTSVARPRELFLRRPRELFWVDHASFFLGISGRNRSSRLAEIVCAGVCARLRTHVCVRLRAHRGVCIGARTGGAP